MVLYHAYRSMDQKMLRISKLTDYATIILNDIALNPLKILSAMSVPTACYLIEHCITPNGLSVWETKVGLA